MGSPQGSEAILRRLFTPYPVGEAEWNASRCEGPGGPEDEGRNERMAGGSDRDGSKVAEGGAVVAHREKGGPARIGLEGQAGGRTATKQNSVAK
jgi:hypothetical protein